MSGRRECSILHRQDAETVTNLWSHGRHQCTPTLSPPTLGPGPRPEPTGRGPFSGALVRKQSTRRHRGYQGDAQLEGPEERGRFSTNLRLAAVELRRGPMFS